MSSSSVSQKLTFDKLGDLFVDDLWLFLVRRGPSSVHDVHRKPDHLDVGDDYLDDVNDKKTVHDYQLNAVDAEDDCVDNYLDHEVGLDLLTSPSIQLTG